MLRPEALKFLRGCDHIIHGGDIGDADILTQLSLLAPVTAVRGNNDTAPWAQSLPVMQRLEIGVVAILVIHDLRELVEPLPAGAIRAVISGHSHQPSVSARANVLYVNPGSAGPRRFRLPVSIAELIIRGASIKARLVALKAPAAPAGTV